MERLSSAHLLRRLALLMVVLCLLTGHIVSAQQQPSGSPISFEVASVRQSQTNDAPTYTGPWNTDVFTVKNASLNYLIEIAFGVQQYQIAGEPTWGDSQRFDVNAKTENGRKIDFRSIQLPLQALLHDRLGLQVHREQKDVSGFELVTTGVKPKLTPATASLNPGYVAAEHLHCTGMPLGGFVSMLAMTTHRPVADRTGIKGSYDFDLRYAAMNDVNSNLPDLFTAIQEELGLKLRPAKVPVDMLVIDHVDRQPTEN